jgi:hypothetical protein
MVNLMKLQPLLLALTVFCSAAPASAEVYMYHESYCYENIEEYVPGYRNRWGRYVGGYVKTTRSRVPCHRHRSYRSEHHHYHSNNNNNQSKSNGKKDDNSCIEGSILGGIAGGGAGAALSRGDGRFWAIPTGIVAGALVGCQIDGG